MMRKLISLLLALVMILALIPTAMANDYTLDIYWVGNGDDTAVRAGVEAAVNAYVEPLIGASVSYHIIGWGDWNDQAISALKAGRKIDLIFTADWEGYGAEVAADLLRPLDELLEQYGQGIREALPQTFLDGVRVNGVLYGIPVKRELCMPQGFIINKTAANVLGWDVTADDPSIQATADLEPWLARYKEMFPDKYPYLMDGQNGRWADEPWCPDWCGLEGNAIAMKMAMGEDGSFDETIYNIFATPEQEEHIRLMYRWGQSGYISPDAALTGFDYNGAFGRGDFLAYALPLKGNGIKAAEMVQAYATAEFECVEITMQPKYIVTSQAGGSMFAIPITCQNPEAAMKYLNLMHSDRTLVNLMLLGVEGENYTRIDENTAQIKADANWYDVHGGARTVVNPLLQYVIEGENPNRNTLLQSWLKDAAATASLGFRFVPDAVADQIAAVNRIVSEMANPLMCGQVDPDDPSLGIEALKAALQENGINEIISEIQAQYDAWKAVR